MRTPTRLLAGAGVCLISLAALPSASGADPRLGKLTCVKVTSSISDEAHALRLREADLEDRLLVGLKAKVPRLPVTATCPNQIRVQVVVLRGQTKAGQKLDNYAGAFTLELYREVLVFESAHLSDAVVWLHGGALSGSLDELQAHISQIVDDALTRFGADYYKAGNP